MHFDPQNHLHKAMTAVVENLWLVKWNRNFLPKKWKRDYRKLVR